MELLKRRNGLREGGKSCILVSGSTASDVSSPGPRCSTNSVVESEMAFLKQWVIRDVGRGSTEAEDVIKDKVG